MITVIERKVALFVTDLFCFGFSKVIVSWLLLVLTVKQKERWKNVNLVA